MYPCTTISVDQKNVKYAGQILDIPKADKRLVVRDLLHVVTEEDDEPFSSVFSRKSGFAAAIVNYGGSAVNAFIPLKDVSAICARTTLAEQHVFAGREKEKILVYDSGVRYTGSPDEAGFYRISRIAVTATPGAETPFSVSALEGEAKVQQFHVLGNTAKDVVKEKILLSDAEWLYAADTMQNYYSEYRASVFKNMLNMDMEKRKERIKKIK